MSSLYTVDLIRLLLPKERKSCLFNHPTLFLKFASGLVLYCLTTNLLTIVQQGVTNKLLDEKEEHDAESQKKHKKDRKQ